ncbi:MAG: heavy-metal-associated domain-containing protein [Proteobacteria bacterium]|nr:heavy-metal-associated domain-containing protein [Pseudomonadota bacterium]
MTLQLKVDGMTCAHCVRAVTDVVHAVAPQAAVAVDLKHGLVTVESAAAISTPAIRQAIEEEGYKVR